MDEQRLEQLGEQLHIEEGVEEEKLAAESVQDEVESLYRGSVRSGLSRRSGRSVQSNLTLVNELEKELGQERRAREKLERELEESKCFGCANLHCSKEDKQRN